MPSLVSGMAMRRRECLNLLRAGMQRVTVSWVQANKGDFHDPRDVRRSFHALACHHYFGRDWEWTDCCGRDVRFAQVAWYDRNFSSHPGTDQRNGVTFSH